MSLTETGEEVADKDATERQETVRDTVRRTDVEQLDTNTEAKSKSAKR